MYIIYEDSKTGKIIKKFQKEVGATTLLLENLGKQKRYCTSPFSEQVWVHENLGALDLCTWATNYLLATAQTFIMD